MTLEQWLRDERREQRWLAGELGCDSASVWRWVHGHTVPHPMFRKEIERITDGAVPVSVWATPANEKRRA